jgi:hypothetical protein
MKSCCFHVGFVQCVCGDCCRCCPRHTCCGGQSAQEPIISLSVRESGPHNAICHASVGEKPCARAMRRQNRRHCCCVRFPPKQTASIFSKTNSMVDRRYIIGLTAQKRHGCCLEHCGIGLSAFTSHTHSDSCTGCSPVR